MKIINYTYKYRLNPNLEQEVLLNKHFGATRFVWNRLLSERQEAYQTENKTLNYYDDARRLVELKRVEEFEWLKEINSQSLQSAAKFLDGAYSDFFKKLKGFPNYKSKKDSNKSFRVPQSTRVENGKLYIPKFKDGIDIKVHRALEGKICFATVTKNAVGQYHASITVEKEIKIKKSKSKKAIGIDLGIKDLIVTSENVTIPNPKFRKSSQKKITKLSRQLAKKQNGSKNRDKARVRLAKEHLKIANQRADYIHKATSKLVNENQVIIMEDLNVRGMVRNHKLAGAISDVAFHEIKRQIEYKTGWQDKIFFQVDRFYPSSKTCAECGFVNKNLKLSDRTWTCPKCNSELLRDWNASRNILWYGLKRLLEENRDGIARIYACGLPSYGRTLLKDNLRSNGREKQEAAVMQNV